MIKVETVGGVDGLPSHLVCGHCQARVEALWDVYLDKKRREIGAVGRGFCDSCRAVVSAIASNDPKFVRDVTKDLKDAYEGAGWEH